MSSLRRSIVGGNWKMNLSSGEVDQLVDDLIAALGQQSDVDVVICPPLVYLDRVAQKLSQTSTTIALGSQDLFDQPNGAYTGEVSTAMLADLGVEWVLTGHSERRHVIGESDVLVNAKTRAALAAGLKVILCVGEQLAQREAGQTDAINIGQLYYGLAGVTAEQMANVVIAYEPVWAIGTGKTATTEDAQAAHVAIRGALTNLYGADVAQTIRIQYGGSCKPGNANELFGQDDIDGGLIGGAALEAASFAAIVEAGR